MCSERICDISIDYLLENPALYPSVMLNLRLFSRSCSENLVLVPSLVAYGTDVIDCVEKHR